MGSYIYNLKTDHLTATSSIAAHGIRVHFTKYAFKLSMCWSNDEDFTRRCGPAQRAFERREWNDNYYVHCVENKTQLCEVADIEEQYGQGKVADDVWGKIVPDSICMMQHCVAVYNTCGSNYCDDSDRRIVGFLVPRFPSGCIMRFDAPDARDQWEFVPARTEAEIMLRDCGVSIKDDFKVEATHTIGRWDGPRVYAITNGGFLYFVGGEHGPHDLVLSETNNERANAHWQGYCGSYVADSINLAS